MKRALLFVTLLITATPAMASEFWIVFGSFRGGDYSSSIHAIRPDGSDERQLSPHVAGFPASLDPWAAPDGELIAFSRGGGNHKSSVWLLDPASGDEQQITGLVMVRFKSGRAWPSLRPDSDLLTYVRESSDERRLFMQDWTGEETADLGPGEFPAWSPDGSKLAFVRDDQVVVRSFDSGMIKPLPTEFAAAGYPSWMPGGQSLLVVAGDGAGADVYEVGLDGAVVRRITETPETVEAAPSGSPDGRYIAWTALSANPSEGWQQSIHVLDTQTGAIVEITSGDYHDSRPTWTSKLP